MIAGSNLNFKEIEVPCNFENGQEARVGLQPSPKNRKTLVENELLGARVGIGPSLRSSSQLHFGAHVK